MQDTDPFPAHSQASRLAGWIRLEQTPGVGVRGARLLLERYATPQAIFGAGVHALGRLVPEAAARALAEPPPQLLDQLARQLEITMAWLAEPANSIVTLDHPAYPPLLREIADPPLFLYVKGRAALLRCPALAVVGSRNATRQGVVNAIAFAQALSDAGLTIVSGLALGIDAAAHEGGLRGPGATVAVIGTGADLVYPAANRALAQRIAAAGCIVSEYPLGQKALPGNFPRRNRLISGMSVGVLVVEAAARSGSLITAHVAAEQGREVFAIPGSIHAALSKGCHKLIKEGAKLVDSAADVLDELKLAPGPAGPVSGPAATPGHAALLEALGSDPVDADTLACLTASQIGQLSAQLLALELAGHVERLPGGLFQRVKH